MHFSDKHAGACACLFESCSVLLLNPFTAFATIEETALELVTIVIKITSSWRGLDVAALLTHSSFLLTLNSVLAVVKAIAMNLFQTCV